MKIVKTTIALLALAVLAGCSSAPKTETGFWNDGLKGKVKSIHEVETVAEGDNIGDVYAVVDLKCNEQGKLTEQVINCADYRDSYAKFGYDYDSKGVLQRRNIYFKNGSLNVYNVYKYDKQGLPKEVVCYAGTTSEELGRCAITFGDTQIREDEIVSDGYDYPVNSFFYTLDGELKGQTDVMGGHANAMFTYDYEHDDTGNWIKRTCYRVRGDGSEPTPSRVTIREIVYW